MSKSIHGLRYHPHYKRYKEMIRRCYVSSSSSYPTYGGMGIKVCNRWLNSMTAFFEDIGEQPSLIHTIDRIDTEGNYCPENCKWSTPTEQANNRKNTTYLTKDGVKDSIANWARKTGIKIGTLRYRNNKGYSEDKLFKK